MNERQANQKYNVILRKVESMMGKNSTNSSQLTRVGKHFLGKEYVGTFAVDRTPILSHLKPFAIINLDRSHSKGTHWVAICYSEKQDQKKNKYVVFDSFGRKSTKILSSLYRFNIVDTDYDIDQRESESNCGQRSMSWCIFYYLYGEDAALLI